MFTYGDVFVACTPPPPLPLLPHVVDGHRDSIMGTGARKDINAGRGSGTVALSSLTSYYHAPNENKTKLSEHRRPRRNLIIAVLDRSLPTANRAKSRQDYPRTSANVIVGGKSAGMKRNQYVSSLPVPSFILPFSVLIFETFSALATGYYFVTARLVLVFVLSELSARSSSWLIQLQYGRLEKNILTQIVSARIGKLVLVPITWKYCDIIEPDNRGFRTLSIMLDFNKAMLIFFF